MLLTVVQCTGQPVIRNIYVAPDVKSGRGEKQSSRLCLSWALNRAGIYQATTREGHSAQSLHSTSGFGDSEGPYREEMRLWVRRVQLPVMVFLHGFRAGSG